MNYCVWHRTNYHGEVLATNLTLDEAKKRADLELEFKKKLWDDGNGQSIRLLSATDTSQVPYQWRVENMTSEAGWVLDLVTVEKTKGNEEIGKWEWGINNG